MPVIPNPNQFPILNGSSEPTGIVAYRKQLTG